MIRFFTDRRRFVLDNIAASRTGNFRFNIGRHDVVCLAGIEGRKAFFEHKDLNPPAGYAVLFNSAPPQPTRNYVASRTGAKFEFTGWFLRKLAGFLHRDYLNQVLPKLLEDVHTQIEQRVPIRDNVISGTIDPFKEIYRIVYKLTIRTLGPSEIADDENLTEETLRYFEMIARSASTARIICPYLPTPGHLKRMYAGAKLYSLIRKLVRDRRMSGERTDDAFQQLIDDGEDELKVMKFVLGALFAGQLNTGISAAWILVYLAVNPEWYRTIQGEVDRVVRECNMADSTQGPAEVFAQMTAEDWDTRFPFLELCLKETIRFRVPTAAMRQNLGESALQIGNTGEEIPKDWFAVYLFDEAHFNPNIYAEPDKWDPSRYLGERKEHMKEPHCYSAWGSGRHPCVGAKFAKLEVKVITACFVASFDWHAVGADGKRLNHQPKAARANTLSPRPEEEVRLQYRAR
ncbi:cytochrome p450 6a1 like protein [Zymoseptoria brevis]|uniref:Cytochrome p450 6a1 like protein n=1 Tax=Zymoseptoria brevis TaxID=1047168 RepID=A0A0F4GTQ7_9PEZI|nr:cytochrome p450 6a1 like protein [Zymoseptoria brevis]